MTYSDTLNALTTVAGSWGLTADLIDDFCVEGLELLTAALTDIPEAKRDELLAAIGLIIVDAEGLGYALGGGFD